MAASWTTGLAFIPNVGGCYEVCFGKIEYKGQTGFWTARIRVTGADSAQWIDFDTNEPLDSDMAKWTIQAFRAIPC